MMLTLTWTTTANSANMALLHTNFNCMTQLHAESPGPIADDAAAEPDVEILDSPADADEFHDAIDQMDRQSINLNNLLTLHFPMLQQLLPRQ